jgi:hypothetical protein
MGKRKIEWVAEGTILAHGRNRQLVESGGIYPDTLRDVGRRLQAGEHEAVCPRCGQRFAATDISTAEENRDLHFNGDENIPSICLDVE